MLVGGRLLKYKIKEFNFELLECNSPKDGPEDKKDNDRKVHEKILVDERICKLETIVHQLLHVLNFNAHGDTGLP